VNLLLMGYNLVTQLFPAVVLSLGRRPVMTAAGAFAGIVAGVATVAYVSLSGTTLATLLPWAPDAVKDLNVGLVALMVNVAVFALVTLVTSRRSVSRQAAAAAPVALTSAEQS
jgi:SSS family solute:Na+ symporter